MKLRCPVGLPKQRLMRTYPIHNQNLFGPCRLRCFGSNTCIVMQAKAHDSHFLGMMPRRTHLRETVYKHVIHRAFRNIFILLIPFSKFNKISDHCHCFMIKRKSSLVPRLLSLGLHLLVRNAIERVQFKHLFIRINVRINVSNIYLFE